MSGVTVLVKKELYPAQAVLAATQAYSDACEVILRETKSHYEVSLKAKSQGISDRKLEGDFLNYLLSVSKTKEW